MPAESLSMDNPNEIGGNQPPTFDPAAVSSQIASDRMMNRNTAAQPEDENMPETSAETQTPAGNEETMESEDEEAEEEAVAAAISRDRQTRMRQAVVSRKQVDDDLKKLGADILSITGGGFNVLKRWMPGLANKITQSMNAGQMRKGQSRVAMLETTVMSLKTLTALLWVARGFTALIDSAINLVQWIGYSSETIIIPILLILFSPLILLIMTIVNASMGSGKLTTVVKNISKKVDDMLKKYEPELEKEKKKLALMRRRTELDVIINSVSKSFK